MARSVEGWMAPKDHAMHSLADETLSHLTESHKTYYTHWIWLLHLEMSTEGSRRGTTTSDLWCKTSKQR